MLRKAVRRQKRKQMQQIIYNLGQSACYHITETMNEQYFSNESS